MKIPHHHHQARRVPMKFSPGLVLLILYLKLSGKNWGRGETPLTSHIWTVPSDAISDVRISGPSVLENGRQQYVDLVCSFQFQPAEYKQLDIKWYFDNEVGTGGTWLEQHFHYLYCHDRHDQHDPDNYQHYHDQHWPGGALPTVGPQCRERTANNRSQISVNICQEDIHHHYHWLPTDWDQNNIFQSSLVPTDNALVVTI